MEVLTKLRKELYKLSDDNLFDDTEISETSESIIYRFLNKIDYLRTADDKLIISEFLKVFKEDRLLALKSLFYIRDINEGLGERQIFRIILNYLAIEEPNLIIVNLNNIIRFGRFDDLYSLFYTPVEHYAIDLIRNQLQLDLNSKYPSNLCKWLKSENCSSKDSIRLAKRTRKLLGMSSKEYRKILSNLRSKLDLVENSLRLKQYDEIEYDKLTIGNIKKYNKAFLKNDKDKFMNYTSQLRLEEKSDFDSGHHSNDYRYNLKDIRYKSSNDVIIYNFDYEKNKDSLILDCSAYLTILTTINSKFLLKGYFMHTKNNGSTKFSKITSDREEEVILNLKSKEINHISRIETYFELLLYTLIKKDEIKNIHLDKIIIISDREEKSINLKNIEDLFLKFNISVPEIIFWYPDINSKDNKYKREYSKISTKVYGHNKEAFKCILNRKYNNKDINRYDHINSIRYATVKK